MIVLYPDRDGADPLPKTDGAWTCRTFEWVRVRADRRPLLEVALVGPNGRRAVEESAANGERTFCLDGAGEYRLRWKDDLGGGEETLVAVPSALSIERDIPLLLRQIGEMAIDLASLCLSRPEVRAGREAGDGVGARTAPGFWGLIETIEAEFEKVRRAPCKDLARRAGPVAVERSTAPGHLMLRRTRPDVRRARGVARVETFDTPENRWLKCLLFDVLGPMVDAERPKEGHEPLLYDEGEREKAWRRAEAEHRELEGRLAALQSAPFLRGVESPCAMPAPTKRLTTREGYAGIYRACTDGIYGDAIQRLDRVRAAVARFADGGVRRLSNLYEVWCLFRLYSDLRHNVGLVPDGPGPQDAILVREGRLEIGPVRSYRLTRDDFAGGELSATLHYEKECEAKGGGKRYPDFVLEIDSPPRILGGGKMAVVLDAKYHEYGALGGRVAPPTARYSLRKDIEGVALAKYLNGLKERVDASFILHPSDGFEWRGEKPYTKFLDGDRVPPGAAPSDLPADDRLSHPGHQIGALLLKPGHPAHSARLLTIVFHHLLGLTSLCLNCGRELTAAGEYVDHETQKPLSPASRPRWDPRDPETRFIAACSMCDNRWRVSFCRMKGVGHASWPDENVYRGVDRFRRNNRIVQAGLPGSPGEGRGIHAYRGDEPRCPQCDHTYSET